MMSDGAKALGRDSEVLTRDIAELVADALSADRLAGPATLLAGAPSAATGPAR